MLFLVRGHSCDLNISPLLLDADISLKTHKAKDVWLHNYPCVSVRFPVSGLSDGQWHHVALSVSAQKLALYVDCSLLESVDWVYHGMGISTDGLLIVGGIIEGFETPLEVSGFHPVLFAQLCIFILCFFFFPIGDKNKY